MAEFKGTKGKWNISSNNTFVLKKEDDNVLARLYYSNSENLKEVPYNALLISKSPEMLEMLNKAAEKLYSVENPSTSCIRLADEIIDLINQSTEL